MSQADPPTLSGVWSWCPLKLSFSVVRQPGLWLNSVCKRLSIGSHMPMDNTSGTPGYGLLGGSSSHDFEEGLLLYLL